MKGYTSRDVAKLLGLTVAQVRAFAHDGFLTPGRGPRGELLFSFQDLVILRTAKGLVAARIPTRRIRRALRRLRSELPRGRSLAEHEGRDAEQPADGIEDRRELRDGAFLKALQPRCRPQRGEPDERRDEDRRRAPREQPARDREILAADEAVRGGLRGNQEGGEKPARRGQAESLVTGQGVFPPADRSG